VRRRLLIPLALVAALAVGVFPASAGPKVPSRLASAAGTADPVSASPARAGFSISRTDGNDTKGALDLRSMKITRGKAQDTVVFTTIGPVSNADIDPANGNFAVLIDNNDDRRYDYAQYIFFQARKLRGVVVNLKTDRVVDRTAPVSRLNTTSFRTVILRSKVGSPGTYRFAVFGFNQHRPCTARRPCIDGIPNQFPLIPLDHTAPTVRIIDLQSFSTATSNDLNSPVEFSVREDRFGIGVKRWTVQRRKVGGGGAWQRVQAGAGALIVDVPGAQGVTYDVRIEVVDKQKNDRFSMIERTSFPLDDRNQLVTYSDPTLTLESPPTAFLGTTTRLEQAQSATLVFEGSGFCVVGHPTSSPGASAVELIVDDEMIDVIRSPAMALQEVCYPFANGSHTAEVRDLSEEPFAVDGFYVIP
jgi:hypothetical protein